MPTKTVTSPEKEIAYVSTESGPGRGWRLTLFFDANREKPYTLKAVRWTQWDDEKAEIYHYFAKTYQQLLNHPLEHGGIVESELPIKGMTEYLYENDLIPEWLGKELIFSEGFDGYQPYSKATLIA